MRNKSECREPGMLGGEGGNKKAVAQYAAPPIKVHRLREKRNRVIILLGGPNTRQRTSANC